MEDKSMSDVLYTRSIRYEFELEFLDIKVKDADNKDCNLVLTEGAEHTDYGTLMEVNFHKEIYQPGCVEFKIQLASTKNSSDYRGLINLKKDGAIIKEATVIGSDGKKLSSSFYIEKEVEPIVIADSYYIFERKVEIKDGNTYLYCKAYSADKFLTIDKFNYAHTGKRLTDSLTDKKADGIVSTILECSTSAIDKFKDSITKDNSNNYFFKNLNHLGVDEIKPDENGNNIITPKEAVIPYCVQYDESFLDFMARICNRYGEFLYCEDNKWHIGLEKTTDKELQGSYSSTKYESCIDFGDGAALLNPNYLNSTSGDNKAYSGNDLKKSNGVLAQEYYQPIENKDYAEFTDYAPHESTLPDFLKSAAAQQNICDAVLKTVAVAGMKHGTSKVFMDDVNEDYDKYYTGLTDDETTDKNDEEIKTKHEFTYTGTTQITADFYSLIENGKALAEKHKLELEFSTYNHLLLGDKVEHKGVDYVVYQIDGGIINKVEYQKVTLVPYIATIATEVKDSDGNKIESECGTTIGVMTIPDGVKPTKTNDTISISTTDPTTQKTTTITASKIKVYPLPLRQSHIRKASPQRAIVVDNFDPERLGRVRVKYPWQPGNPDATEENKDLGDATPWLRVAYPMASKESGFMFFPKEGDEVLIDYEEGDIERPFVNGSFYSATNQPSVPSSTHRIGAVKSITSDNGHHISFTDTSGTKFVDELIPVFSMLSKFGIKVNSWVENTDVGKYLGGGFEIADYLGVYSITGSTHGRNITISSPAGDVVIDAFTGITINAPHGDVNIVGKNVNIEARNNLTMTSGTNIKQPYFWHRNKKSRKEDLGKRLVSAFFNNAQKFAGLDLSFHRTWLEVLLRPIGGTMRIKSHRYMHLEAGEGEAKYVKKLKTESLKNTLWEGVRGRHSFQEVNFFDAEKLRLYKGKINANTKYHEDLFDMRKLFIQINDAIRAYWDNKKVDGENVAKIEDEKGIMIRYIDEIINHEKSSQDKNKTELSPELKTIEDLCNQFFEKESSAIIHINTMALPTFETNYNSFKSALKELKTVIDSLEVRIGNITYSYNKKVKSLETIKEISKRHYDETLEKLINSSSELPSQIEKTTEMSVGAEVIPLHNGFRYEKKKDSKLERFKTGLAEYVGLKGFVDDDVWGQNHKGKILFSDNKNSTYYLNGKVITEEPKDEVDAIVDVINRERDNLYGWIDKYEDDRGLEIQAKVSDTESV